MNFDVLKLLKSVGAQLLSVYSRRLLISQWSANSFQTNNVQLHSVCKYYGNLLRNASVNVVDSGQLGDVGNLPRQLAAHTFDCAGINIKDWVFDQGQQSNSTIIRWSVVVFHFAVLHSLSKFVFFVCFRFILVLFRIYNWLRTRYESRNDGHHATLGTSSCICVFSLFTKLSKWSLTFATLPSICLLAVDRGSLENAWAVFTLQSKIRLFG